MKSGVEDKSPGDGFYFSSDRLLLGQRPGIWDWLSSLAPDVRGAKSQLPATRSQFQGYSWCPGFRAVHEVRREKVQLWAQSKKCQGRREDPAVMWKAGGGTGKQGLQVGPRKTGGWSLKWVKHKTNAERGGAGAGAPESRADVLHTTRLRAGQARGEAYKLQVPPSRACTNSLCIHSP